jgi:hypothetical protein
MANFIFQSNMVEATLAVAHLSFSVILPPLRGAENC